MEDVLKILLILGFVIFGVVKKARKEAKNDAPTDEWDTPTPQSENPMPEAWGSGEIQVETIPKAPQPAAKPKAENIFPPRHRHKAPVQESARTTRAASPVLNENPDSSPSPDVDIHSIEEVRRGIIWAEILNRKY